MCKKCIFIIAILVFVILGGVYKFMIKGSVTEDIDGRKAIYLSLSERNVVLKEMREFLNSLAQITKGITEKDRKLIAEYALKVGNLTRDSIPGTLMGKLPMSFKKLGFDTHAKFDQIAKYAKTGMSEKDLLKKTAVLMQNCVVCHATHRIELEK